MFKVIVLFMCVASALAQSMQSGVCFPASKAVVQNFNIAQFSGQWHQIERITGAETGDCITSTLAAAANGAMTVAHRSVVNGVAQLTNGILTRTTNSTEGRWTVSYPPATQTLPYLILSTDYTGFAFVYSCVGVTNNTYQEYGWKLSRTTSLSTAQATAISNALQPYPTLVGATWRSTSHTTAACRVNGSYAINASAVLVLVAMFMGLKQTVLG